MRLERDLTPGMYLDAQLSSSSSAWYPALSSFAPCSPVHEAVISRRRSSSNVFSEMSLIRKYPVHSKLVW